MKDFSPDVRVRGRVIFCVDTWFQNVWKFTQDPDFRTIQQTHVKIIRFIRVKTRDKKQQGCFRMEHWEPFVSCVIFNFIEWCTFNCFALSFSFISFCEFLSQKYALTTFFTDNLFEIIKIYFWSPRVNVMIQIRLNGCIAPYTILWRHAS